MRDNLVTGCTAAFRSDYKDLVIPVPAACAHNSWAALVIAAVADVARIEAPLLAYRQHAANQSGLARYRGEHLTDQRMARTPRRQACSDRAPGGAPAGGAPPPGSQPRALSDQPGAPPHPARRHPPRRAAVGDPARDQPGAARADDLLGPCDAPSVPGRQGLRARWQGRDGQRLMIVDTLPGSADGPRRLQAGTRSGRRPSCSGPSSPCGREDVTPRRPGPAPGTGSGAGARGSARSAGRAAPARARHPAHRRSHRARSDRG